MELQYARSWFRAEKHLTDPWTAEKARKAYDARTLHAVVLGPPERPIAFIEFNMDYVGVGFLDKHLRECLGYTFVEVSPGRLFLSEATHREFDGDSDRVISGTSYYFQPDGLVNAVSETFDHFTHSERHFEADVKGNWEAYPKFGEYEPLLNRQRGGAVPG